jgi:Protein of unknown function (DUF559)
LVSERCWPVAIAVRRPVACARHSAPTSGRHPARSELERRALELFGRAGLPLPRVNSIVPTNEGPLEVDFCWPDRRLVAEADGFEFHGTRAAFERDRRRDQLLRMTGRTTVRITWRQLNDAPHEVVAAVRVDAFSQSNGPT